jgi:hypothetical protein
LAHEKLYESSSNVQMTGIGCPAHQGVLDGAQGGRCSGSGQQRQQQRQEQQRRQVRARSLSVKEEKTGVEFPLAQTFW